MADSWYSVTSGVRLGELESTLEHVPCDRGYDVDLLCRSCGVQDNNAFNCGFFKFYVILQIKISKLQYFFLMLCENKNSLEFMHDLL